MRIGIMGGTFDPPHMAHIVMVEIAAAQLNLDTVYFVPAFIQPHKRHEPVTDPFHRVAMLSLALAPNPKFKLCTLELAKGSVSYTYDTLLEFKRNLHPGNDLFFIMGSDSFLELDTWHRYEELLELSEFIIINRGSEIEQLTQNLQNLEGRLHKTLSGRIHFARSETLPVSSTAIRESIGNGRRVDELLPKGVEAYILKHSLYQRR